MGHGAHGSMQSFHRFSRVYNVMMYYSKKLLGPESKRLEIVMQRVCL